MKLLIISDLEGKTPKSLKRFCIKNKIDYILSAGDFGDGSIYKPLIFKYWDQSLEEALGIEKLDRILKKEYENGLKVLRNLEKINIPVYIILGNHDHNRRGRIGSAGKYKKVRIYESYGNIVKRLKNIKYVSGKSIKLNDSHISATNPQCAFFNLISLDVCQRCIYQKKDIREMKTKRKKKIRKIQKIFENRMKKMLNNITDLSKNRKQKAKRSEKFQNIILMTHQPPYFCKLDKIRNKKSPRNGEHIGNVVLRKLIKKYQPLLCICGHMHENQGKCRIGKTLIVNGGFGRKGEAAIINIRNRNIGATKIKPTHIFKKVEKNHKIKSAHKLKSKIKVKFVKIK